MNLQFKTVNIDNLEELLPFYNLRHNRTCDSVFWRALYGKSTIMSDMQSGRGKRFYG